MDLQRYCIKFFLKSGAKINHPAVVEVFHEWVKEQVLPISLIDVADYAHVPDGPGTLLVGHEANLFIDDLSGEEGLVYQCKTEQTGSLKERINQAIDIAKNACEMLQQVSATGADFDLGVAHFISNDRLLLPNTDAGYNDALPALKEISSDMNRVINDSNERLAIRMSLQ